MYQLVFGIVLLIVGITIYTLAGRSGKKKVSG